MSRTFWGGLATAVFANSLHAETPKTASQRQLLDKYCVICHSERLRTGGLTLEKASVDDLGAGAEVWEKVLAKVRTGQMPPARMPRPDQATLEGFTSWLETGLDRAAAEHPNPGRVGIHRLNRTEYTNAIRDLLALEIDGRSLLVADDLDQHGLDNIASVLTVSPALLESYMGAARKISRMAVGDAKTVPVFETYKLPAALVQDTRMSEDLPFGSRGGMAIEHRFPADGEYTVKVRLRRTLYDYIIGMGQPHQLEVRLNHKLIKRFTIGGDAPPNGSPASFAGSIMGDPKWDLYMHEADAHLEVRFSAKAGLATLGVSFTKDTVAPEDIPQPRERGFGLATNEHFDGNPAVDSVVIGGPYNPKGPGETVSRNRIFVCKPTGAGDERACAERMVSKLARGAYRRPVSPAEVQALMGFYDVGQKQGGFEGGIQLALQRTLADPNFLFRLERAPAGAERGTVYALSDVELASRLSFFLWSSIPDDELIELAAQGKLKDPSVLEQQVRRMLKDGRSKALVENFGSGWLGLRKLRDMMPDPVQFPEFDENLRQAFEKETELFVESQMRADRGIVELLTANYTFVNDRLAQHYGIPNVYGSHFRRVELKGGERGGLIGQGSILMTTSYPNRTSPVLRGKWLLENVLGMAPPPPPPDVPALKESTSDKPSSVRERLEEHRKNAACAVCHVRMDPLGFALENFDATGKWRTMSDGVAVDAKAAFPDGRKFEGVEGLRKLLEGDRDRFVETFTERLLTYALGRTVEYYDYPSIRKITKQAAGSDYRWSAIIVGIVKSLPFQNGIVQEPAASNE